MGRYVVKHGDAYLVWSSIVDAPITMACSLEEMRAWWKEEYGRAGLEELDKQVARGEIGELADEVVCNRAGAGETEMSLEQLVDYYVVKRNPRAHRPLGKVRR